MLPEKRIDDLVALLQDNHSCSITISTHQLNNLQKETTRSNNKKKLELPPSEQEDRVQKKNVISLLELEAEALVLELELLAAA